MNTLYILDACALHHEFDVIENNEAIEFLWVR